ncbi:MAG: alpha/beta fold hydrolase [Deltaproteobacteria bacterium]
MPVCTLRHHVMYYQSSGSSTPAGTLLFMHGSGASAESWRKQMNDLPPGFLGIALDLPGHGHSMGPALDQVTDLARIVLDFVRELALPRPLILAGHSLGAAICLQASCLDSAVMDSLILIGGGARMRVLPAFLNGLAAGTVDPGFFELGFAPSTDPLLVKEESVRYAEVSAEVLFRDFTACNEFDVVNDLPAVSIPVLLIVGEDDRLTPPKNSLFVQEHLAEAELVIIPDAGHFAMLEKPGHVNQAIHQFIEQVRVKV